MNRGSGFSIAKMRQKLRSYILRCPTYNIKEFRIFGVVLFLILMKAVDEAY